MNITIDLPQKERAVVLLSGGMDSATCAAVARSEGYELHALTFLYGQHHKYESSQAEELVRFFDIQNHKIITLDLRAFGNSALTDNIAIPKDRTTEQMKEGIPVTYVPGRNTIFLSFALAFAEVCGATRIYIGCTEGSVYPDCQPEYIASYNKLIKYATKATVEGRTIQVRAPLIVMTKAEIIQLGTQLGVDYSLTRSCYDLDDVGGSCGRCDACIQRIQGFRAAGLTDPLVYSNSGGLHREKSG